MQNTRFISCIVPYYNDNGVVNSVLDILTRVAGIASVICIDDGSDNPSTSKKIKKQFPKVQIIRREQNSGKSEAVKFALGRVNTPYVMLFDADITKTNPSEIDSVLDFIYQDPSIDMLVLRRPEPFLIRLFRWDILLAGERVLRTEDLREIFLKHPPRRYELEYAINSYMMRNRKKVFWAKYSGINTYKKDKIGFFRGVAQDIGIHYDFVKYTGIWFAIKSSLFFCRRGLPRIIHD